MTPLVLTDSQREHYLEHGWLSVPGFVSEPWLEKLRAVTNEFVDQSRTLTESNVLFDLDVGHSEADPRLRRLSSPTDLHETYWEFASQSEIVDAVVDLIGQNVKFHHSKLNFKAAHGGEEVKWHQDIQFWPQTNYDLLTVGVFLEDVESGMGEVGFVSGSHEGPLYDLYDGDRWVGALNDDDVAAAAVDGATYPVGAAGTITMHNCRTVHGSAPNSSDSWRPLLLQTYAPADAYSYTDLLRHSPHGEELIRGEPARWARHDPRPCLMPPERPLQTHLRQPTTRRLTTRKVLAQIRAPRGHESAPKASKAALLPSRLCLCERGGSCGSLGDQVSNSGAAAGPTFGWRNGPTVGAGSYLINGRTMKWIAAAVGGHWHAVKTFQVTWSAKELH